jgi:hypothetical protein
MKTTFLNLHHTLPVYCVEEHSVGVLQSVQSPLPAGFSELSSSYAEKSLENQLNP